MSRSARGGDDGDERTPGGALDGAVIAVAGAGGPGRPGGPAAARRGGRHRGRRRRATPERLAEAVDAAAYAAGGATSPATSSTSSTRVPPGTGPTAPRSELGRVDGLVHLVGGWRGGASFTDTDLADWDVPGRPADPHRPAHLPRLPRRPAAQRRTAASCSSAQSGATKPTAGNAAYAAAKAAAEAWTLALARLLPQGGGRRGTGRRGCHPGDQGPGARRDARRRSPNAKFAGFTDVDDLAAGHRRRVEPAGSGSEREPPVADAPTVTEQHSTDAVRRHDPHVRGFASDNYAGVHPEVLAALALANGGHQVAYGEDDYTEHLQEVFRRHFGPRAEAFPVFNGTGANVIALQAVTDALGRGDLRGDRAHQHRRVRRAGAGRRAQAADRPHPGRQAHPRADRPAGVRLRRRAPRPAAGRLDHPDHRTGHLLHARRDPRHLRARPRARHGACTSTAPGSPTPPPRSDVPLRAFTTDVGVDVLSFGGTKNGLLLRRGRRGAQPGRGSGR